MLAPWVLGALALAAPTGAPPNASLLQSKRRATSSPSGQAEEWDDTNKINQTLTDAKEEKNTIKMEYENKLDKFLQQFLAELANNAKIHEDAVDNAVDNPFVDDSDTFQKSVDNELKMIKDSIEKFKTQIGNMPRDVASKATEAAEDIAKYAEDDQEEAQTTAEKQTENMKEEIKSYKEGAGADIKGETNDEKNDADRLKGMLALFRKFLIEVMEKREGEEEASVKKTDEVYTGEEDFMKELENMRKEQDNKIEELRNDITSDLNRLTSDASKAADGAKKTLNQTESDVKEKIKTTTEEWQQEAESFDDDNEETVGDLTKIRQQIQNDNVVKLEENTKRYDKKFQEYNRTIEDGRTALLTFVNDYQEFVEDAEAHRQLSEDQQTDLVEKAKRGVSDIKDAVDTRITAVKSNSIRSALDVLINGIRQLTTQEQRAIVEELAMGDEKFRSKVRDGIKGKGGIMESLKAIEAVVKVLVTSIVGGQDKLEDVEAKIKDDAGQVQNAANKTNQALQHAKKSIADGMQNAVNKIKQALQDGDELIADQTKDAENKKKKEVDDIYDLIEGKIEGYEDDANKRIDKDRSTIGNIVSESTETIEEMENAAEQLKTNKGIIQKDVPSIQKIVGAIGENGLIYKQLGRLQADVEQRKEDMSDLKQGYVADLKQAKDNDARVEFDLHKATFKESLKTYVEMESKKRIDVFKEYIDNLGWDSSKSFQDFLKSNKAISKDIINVKQHVNNVVNDLAETEPELKSKAKNLFRFLSVQQGEAEEDPPRILKRFEAGMQSSETTSDSELDQSKKGSESDNRKAIYEEAENEGSEQSAVVEKGKKIVEKEAAKVSVLSETVQNQDIKESQIIEGDKRTRDELKANLKRTADEVIAAENFATSKNKETDQEVNDVRDKTKEDVWKGTTFVREKEKENENLIYGKAVNEAKQLKREQWKMDEVLDNKKKALFGMAKDLFAAVEDGSVKVVSTVNRFKNVETSSKKQEEKMLLDIKNQLEAGTTNLQYTMEQEDNDLQTEGGEAMNRLEVVSNFVKSLENKTEAELGMVRNYIQAQMRAFRDTGMERAWELMRLIAEVKETMPNYSHMFQRDTADLQQHIDESQHQIEVARKWTQDVHDGFDAKIDEVMTQREAQAVRVENQAKNAKGFIEEKLIEATGAVKETKANTEKILLELRQEKEKFSDTLGSFKQMVGNDYHEAMSQMRSKENEMEQNHKNLQEWVVKNKKMTLIWRHRVEQELAFLQAKEIHERNVLNTNRVQKKVDEQGAIGSLNHEMKDGMEQNGQGNLKEKSYLMKMLTAGIHGLQVGNEHYEQDLSAQQQRQDLALKDKVRKQEDAFHDVAGAVQKFERTVAGVESKSKGLENLVRMLPMLAKAVYDQETDSKLDAVNDVIASPQGDGLQSSLLEEGDGHLQDAEVAEETAAVNALNDELYRDCLRLSQQNLRMEHALAKGPPVAT